MGIKFCHEWPHLSCRWTVLHCLRTVSSQHLLSSSSRREERGAPSKRTPHLQDTGWVSFLSDCSSCSSLIHLVLTTAGLVIHPSPLVHLPPKASHFSLDDRETKKGVADAATLSNSDFKVICGPFLLGLQGWEGKPEALFVLGAKQGIKSPSRVCPGV